MLPFLLSMKQPVLFGMLALLAGAAGYFAGLKDPPRQKPSRPSDSIAKPWATATAGRESGIEAIDVPGTEAQLLSVLRHGSVEDLMKSLDAVLADQRMPQAIAQIYRDALVARLVQLGASDTLFASDGFSADEATQVAGAAMRALVRQSADTAEAALDRMPPGEKRKQALGELLRELGRTNPERGLALIEKDPAGRESAGILFSAWAEKDPKAAFEAAQERSEALASALPAVISKWAPRDPDAAWQAIETLSSDRYRMQEVFFSGLVHHDAGLALEIVARTPTLADSYMLQWVGMRIANDFDEANAAVEMLPPGIGRSNLIQGIARAHSQNPEGVLEWADTLLPGERTAAINDLFDSLGQTDPAKAFDLASSTLPPNDRKDAIAGLVGGWARDDFDAAFAAVTGTMDVETMREALPQLFINHGFPDADSVRTQIGRIMELPADRRADVYRAWGMGSGWGLRPETIDQVERLAAEDRTAFAEGVMERFIEVSSDSASRLIALLPPDHQAKHAHTIAHAMRFRPERETAGFLARLPETEFADSKRVALNSVVREWAYADPDAAVAFVATLPHGATKDQATADVVRQIRRFDLNRASAAAATISDTTLRAQILGEVSADWARVDPARGRAVLQPLLKSDSDRLSTGALFSTP